MGFERGKMHAKMVLVAEKQEATITNYHRLNLYTLDSYLPVCPT